MKGTQEYNLQRFLDAQDGKEISLKGEIQTYPKFSTALNQIKGRKKTSDWIWYIFPQLSGLGISSESEYFALKDLDEAKAYLKDPTLLQRYLEITKELHNSLAEENSIIKVLIKEVDVMQVISSLTLMEAAASNILTKSKFDVSQITKLDEIKIHAGLIFKKTSRSRCPQTLDLISTSQQKFDELEACAAAGAAARHLPLFRREDSPGYALTPTIYEQQRAEVAARREREAGRRAEGTGREAARAGRAGGGRRVEGTGRVAARAGRAGAAGGAGGTMGAGGRVAAGGTMGAEEERKDRRLNDNEYNLRPSSPPGTPTQRSRSLFNVRTGAAARREKAGGAGGDDTYSPLRLGGVDLDFKYSAPERSFDNIRRANQYITDTPPNTPPERQRHTDSLFGTRSYTGSHFGLTEESDEEPTMSSDHDEIENLQLQIRNLNQTIEELKIQYSEQLEKRDLDVATTFLLLEADIESLKKQLAEAKEKESDKITASKPGDGKQKTPNTSSPPSYSKYEIDQYITEIASMIGGVKFDETSHIFVPDPASLRQKALTYKDEYGPAIRILQEKCNSGRYKALSKQLINDATNIAQCNPANLDKGELKFFSMLLEPRRKTRGKKVEISFSDKFHEIENANILADYLAKWDREDFNEYITKHYNQPAYKEWRSNKDNLDHLNDSNNQLIKEVEQNNDKREELDTRKKNNNIGMMFSSFIGLASLITGIALAVIFQNPYLLLITSGTIISTIGYFTCSSNYNKYNKEDKKLNKDNKKIIDKCYENGEAKRKLNQKLDGSTITLQQTKDNERGIS